MELKQLTYFFNARIYVVPSYQRGYSWQKKQIEDFLDDIKNAVRLDSNHYTGTITIQKQNETEKIGLNNFEIYHLVDGQQRITTLILILSYLTKKLKNNGNKEDAEEKEKTYIVNRGSYLFRYEIDKTSEEYFKSLILEKENLSSLDENHYTRNLKVAKKIISDYFAKNEDKELDFLNAIEEKLLFNEYIILDPVEIGIVFETMNNRGVDLSNLEIVKNRLMYLTSKIKLEEENESTVKKLSEQINQKWSIILRNLTLPEEVLDEDAFLSNHWIIYKGWNKDNQAKNEILNKEFTIEKMADNPESTKSMMIEISKYIDSLATASLHWRFINYPTEDKAFPEIENEKLRYEIKSYLEKLNRLSNSTVRPLILAFMPLMNENPLFLLELIQLTEIFSFRLFSMNRRRSDTGKNDIYRKCNDFHLNCSNEETQNKAMYLLAWYIDSYGDKERFELEIDELFKSNKKMGYYSWGALNYFLYEYEEHIRGSEDHKVQFSKSKSKSVEHVLPQTTERTVWEKILVKMDKNGIKRYTHSIGNLVLINSDKNSELLNSSFDKKKEGYKKGSFSEIEIANENNSWTINKIKQREKRMLTFLDERWKLNESFLEKYSSPYEYEEEIEDEDEEEIEEYEGKLEEYEEVVML